MSSFDDLINAGMSEMESVVPTPFILNNKNYVGVHSQAVVSSQLQDGGYVDQLKDVLLVRKETFKALTDVAKTLQKQRLTMMNKQFRIESVNEDRTSYTLILTDTLK